jgi:hypothetical protein
VYHPLEADERFNAQGRIEQPTSCAGVATRHALIDGEASVYLGEVGGGFCLGFLSLLLEELEEGLFIVVICTFYSWL